MKKKAGNLNKPKRSAGNMSSVIGRNLCFYRKKAGMSQRQAARIIGISYQQLQKYEQGSNRICAEYMFLLKNAYKISMDDFFAGVKVNGRKPVSDINLPVEDAIAADIFRKVASIENVKLKKV
jgi:transcriptional regulator with XRE-family HTH domain